jgi:hypothetical protein
MGIIQLIDAKRHLARDKDIEDIALLESYLKRKK